MPAYFRIMLALDGRDARFAITYPLRADVFSISALVTGVNLAEQLLACVSSVVQRPTNFVQRRLKVVTVVRNVMRASSRECFYYQLEKETLSLQVKEKISYRDVTQQ